VPVFDVDAARKAGRSDNDILKFLAYSRGYDLENALKYGERIGKTQDQITSELIQHLSNQPPKSMIAGAAEAAVKPFEGLALLVG